MYVWHVGLCVVISWYGWLTCRYIAKFSVVSAILGSLLENKTRCTLYWFNLLYHHLLLNAKNLPKVGSLVPKVGCFEARKCETYIIKLTQYALSS